MVQTNQQWWNTAKLLRYVDSQEEFNNYNEHLDKYTQMKSFYMWNSSRQNFFWFRHYAYMALFNHHFRLSPNYTKPGLEVKFALEEAEKLGA